MSIITTMLRQTAVYWSPLSVDEYGQPTWNAPVELAVRWEDKIEAFMDADGERQFSRAVVFVESDVILKGVLLLSALVDVDNLTDPKANEGAWEIRKFDKLPNLKNTEFLRTAFL